MSNRTAAIALGALGCAAIAGLTSLSAGPARAADECLSAPKGATPPGAHWYYRLEKGTKRKCWYLADEAARASKAAAAPADDAATTAAAPAKPKAKAARAAAVEDAHAELTAPDSEQPTLAETTWPPLPEQKQPATAQAAPPAAGDPPSAASAAPDAPGDATVAARWPAGTAADMRTPQTAAPAPRMQVAAATPTPAATATGHAVPTAQAAHDDVLSPFRILLIAVTLALALLAVLVSVLFKYVWRRGAAAAPTNRQSIWDMAASAADAPRDPAAARRVAGEPGRTTRDHRVRSQPARPFGAQPSREPHHRIAPEQDHRVDEIEALLRATRDQTA